MSTTATDNKRKYNGSPKFKRNQYSHPTLSCLLDDLCSRFIVNCPPEEYESQERICFQLELAHWFYVDYYRELDPSLPDYKIKDFIVTMFNHCPFLRNYAKECKEIISIYKKWIDYKTRVPVFGAVLLNSNLEKCLLVKGYSPRASWGFPKGKINKDEPEMDCAVREVLEETGFDLTGLINEEDYIEIRLSYQRIKLFIVPFIDERLQFTPLTKKEISKIEWHDIVSIPTSPNEAKERLKYDLNVWSANYYHVIPFLVKLKQWIARKMNQMKNLSDAPRMITSPIKIRDVTKDSKSLTEFSPVKRVTKIDTRSSEEKSQSDSRMEGGKNNSFLSFHLRREKLMECFSF